MHSAPALLHPLLHFAPAKDPGFRIRIRVLDSTRIGLRVSESIWPAAIGGDRISNTLCLRRVAQQSVGWEMGDLRG